MFSLLVHYNGIAWEQPNGSMSIGRFKEYSGSEADAISLADAASLVVLEDVPALLMYELQSDGPSPRLVRHGRLRDIKRVGNELAFRFEPDPQRGYLTRGLIEEYADQLNLHRAEQHRTHWAIKNGELPAALLAKATAEPPVRNLAIVAQEYAEALAKNNVLRFTKLRAEFEEFPASTEKAVFFLQTRPQVELPLESLPVTGVEPRTPTARQAIRRILAAPQDHRSFSLAWFLDYYGGPTEQIDLERALNACTAEIAELRAGGVDADPEKAIFTLWRCARSGVLARRLRRNASEILDVLAEQQGGDGSWRAENGATDFRTTAFATVALQRLGDDKHRDRTRSAVVILCRGQTAEGGFPRRPDEAPEPLTTALALEAVRRSDCAADLEEEIERGEAWLFQAQARSGAWESADFEANTVTTIALDYFSRRSAVLAQVDGFFLMARDFFRKAEELGLDGGANNRRLAAIAAVHATEMFLYGLFERRPDLGLSAYRDNGVETIGPREALRLMQERLYEAGLLVLPRRLAFRDQITSLISRRDSIIHRAHEISDEELRTGLKNVRAFIDRYGAQLATVDLLQ
jgi:hypothetical protein